MTPHKADRAVTDHRHDFARLHSGRDRRMVAGAHHVGECQERPHEGVVGSDRKRQQRSVRERNPDRLALSAIELGAAPPAAVDAGSL
jgi:hypothetical protein